MAADASVVAQQEAVPLSAQPAAGGASKPKDEDAPAPEQDEEDGGVWDSASLYEEILDEVEAFEYSTDGESGLRCAFHCSN
jgi:NAD-dependent histone deacetylase SIR2